MDEHDDEPMSDDAELGALLQWRADQLVGPIDVDAALTWVRQRARARRRTHLTVATAMAAAALVVAVITLASLDGADRRTVRTPAAPGPAPASSGPVTAATPLPEPTTSAAPPPPTSTTAPIGPVLPGTLETTTTLSPGVARYSSAGGTIAVRLTDGRIRLDEDPVPTSGWSVRVDDDGPDRVRVRFERGELRSEIRVELQDGELIPRVTEG